MSSQTDVGVLGATGMVGQQFIARLANHPWFNVSWLAASERSEGKPYAEAAPWRLATPMPDAVPRRDGRGLRARAAARRSCFPRSTRRPPTCSKPQFAAAGHIVLSNARSFRMDPLVPLLIPEVNADHLDTPRRTAPAPRAGPAPSSPIPTARRSCSRWRWRRCVSSASRSVLVTTMQAVSGAGYPGVASLDILGNIIPFIGGGEEEKIETGDAEDSGRRRRPRAARRRHQRAGQSRARDRRSHDDRVGRAGVASVCRCGRRRDARRSAASRRS